MAGGQEASTSFTWQYKPSVVGAVIGVVVFGLLTFAHIFRFVKTRTKPCIPFIFAAFNEAGGYAMRIPAASNPTSSFLYLTSLMLLLISPMMAAGGLYSVLSRLIQSTPPYQVERSPMRPTLFNKVFGIGDMVLMLMITVGATMASRGNESVGKQILLGGIGIHTVSLAIFTVIGGVWHKRVVKSAAIGPKPIAPSLKMNMWAMYIACGTITLRNEARFAEFLLGHDSFLQKKEFPFYIYDFALIAIALSVSLKWYGSEDLKSYTERGMMELEDGVAFAGAGAQPSISAPMDIAGSMHGNGNRGFDDRNPNIESTPAWRIAEYRQSFGVDDRNKRVELA